jgi:hypothetical protein
MFGLSFSPFKTKLLTKCFFEQCVTVWIDEIENQCLLVSTKSAQREIVHGEHLRPVVGRREFKQARLQKVGLGRQLWEEVTRFNQRAANGQWFGMLK